MRLTVVTPPAAEPVTVGEAREWCRITHDLDNELLETLITAARQAVEVESGRALAEQTLRLTLPAFPASSILRLPRAPLRSVQSVEYYDEAGTLQTLDPGDYVVITDQLPGSIRIGASDEEPGSWPETMTREDAVQVTYVCGHGSGAEAAPHTLLVAVRYLVEQFYRERAAGEPPRQLKYLCRLSKVHFTASE